jgi:hypothetical protein
MGKKKRHSFGRMAPASLIIYAYTILPFAPTTRTKITKEKMMWLILISLNHWVANLNHILDDVKQKGSFFKK